MRRARHKSKEQAFYHICTRVAGPSGYYPLQDRRISRKLSELTHFLVEVFCCQLVAFEIMGNHYHFIVFFEKFHILSREDLIQRARKLYGRRFEVKTAKWTDDHWELFNRRLFCVSTFMQIVNGNFGTWFNRKFNRRGHFWADRFKSSELLDLEAVQECLLYIELNSLRAGLVRRPEQWKAGSARLRWKKKDQKLMPLSEIFKGVEGDVYAYYRSRLYHRGAVPTRPGQAHIAQETLDREMRRGFNRAGLYEDRLRFFSDGIALGGYEKVKNLLDSFRSQNIYKRRKNPISQMSGLIFSLREQRSHAFSPINLSPG